MAAPLAETQCHDDHSTIMQSCKYKKLMSSMSTKQINMVRLLLGKSKVDSLPVTAIALVCGTVPYIADIVEPHHLRDPSHCMQLDLCTLLCSVKTEMIPQYYIHQDGNTIIASRSKSNDAMNIIMRSRCRNLASLSTS